MRAANNQTYLRIGLITFNRSLNYGSVLQAWALEHVLRLFAADVEIIDYEPYGYKELYSIFKKPNSIKHIRKDILHLYWLSFFIRRKHDFSQFSKRYLSLTNKRYSYKDNISEFYTDKDILICGSDQIWNPRATDFDDNFFFPDVRGKKKAAYAVSLGKGDLKDSDHAETIRSWVNDFSYLSAREESGAAKIRDLLDNKREVSVVLDPTLLTLKH